MSLRGLGSRLRTIDVSDIPQSKEGKELQPPGYDATYRAGGASTSGVCTSKSISAGSGHVAVNRTEETPEMFQRRTAALSSLSFSPLKQVAMTSFMMYMAGTNLHFFSILTVINGVYSPITAIVRSRTMFQRPEGSKVDVISPRMTFCMIHLAGLLFALYRVMLMGLLPISIADYSASIVDHHNGGWIGVRGLW